MAIRRTAEITVDAAVPQVSAVLLDVAALAEWNPAFSEIRAAGPVVVGAPVPIRVRGLLGGSLVYQHVAVGGIDMDIRVPVSPSGVPGASARVRPARW